MAMICRGLCHWRLSLPSPREFEVTTTSKNFGEGLRDTGEDIRAIMSAAASDQLEHVIDGHPRRVLSCLADLPHGALGELLEAEHEVRDLAHMVT